MTRNVKKWLFYAAVTVFLLLSYAVILYAQGYKYSFSEGKFQRTGVISLKVNVGSRVFVNDELAGDTSLFGNSFGADRLLPGTYKVNVQKDNYSSWQKNIQVEEGLVSDFSNIILLPQEGEEKQKLAEEIDLLFKELEPMATLKPVPAPKPRASVTPSPEITDPYLLDVKNKKLLSNTDQQLITVADNVMGFRLSENKNKLFWWTTNELWVLWLNEQKYQPFHQEGDKELITRFSQAIQGGSWFRGEDHVILELEARDLKNRPYSVFKLVEIDRRGGVNILEL